jgi:hypothetical protein
MRWRPGSMATVWPIGHLSCRHLGRGRFSLARNPSVSSDQRVMPSNTKGSAGGAAAAGGMEFQARVVAWLASRVVAEAPAPWELKPAVLEAVGAETSQPVDDAGALTSSDGYVAVQAKQGLRASASDGPFAEALWQVVEQYRDGVPDGRGQIRAVDPARDRLVLAVDMTASLPIRIHLSKVVDRLRSHPQGTALTDVAVNKQQRTVLDSALAHLRREWTKVFGSTPTDDELHTMLRVFLVTSLDVEDGGTDRERALERLRQVLHRPDHAEAAWATLLTHAHHLAATRGWSRREELVRVLEQAGHAIGPRASLQADIRQLRALTDANLDAIKPHASLVTPQGLVRLPRTVGAELAAATGDLVVTGVPGSGKTALLRELAVTLREQGDDVVLLTADALPGRAGQARIELGLENDVTAVLTGWTGSPSATLVVDGLDAIRGEDASRWLRDLVGALRPTRWRVVVSIRQFDLHHSLDWQRVFQGAPVSIASERRDPQLPGVRHLLVGDLTDDELAVLSTASAQLAGLLLGASPRLRELLRNPFNLSLVAELLTAGQSQASLAQLRSQLELLQRYWQHRVTHGGDGLQRVLVLTTLTTAMVNRRRLQIDAVSVLDTVELGVVEALLRDGVLRETASRLLASGGRRVLFAHHVLFDFAVAALLLGDEEQLTRLGEQLDADPSLAVLARPSLDLHLADVWQAEPGHATFWRLALRLSLPVGHALAAVAAAAAAVQEVDAPSDLAPLADALASREQAAEAAHALVGWIASTLALADERTKQQARAALPAYAWLARRLAEILQVADDIAHAQTLVRLVWQLEDLAPLQPGDPGATERAAASAALMELALADPATRERLADRAARFLVSAVAVDPERYGPVLQRSLAGDVLVKWGVTALQRYVDEITVLARVAPTLAAEVAEALHGFDETRDEGTSLTGSAILSLISPRKQDLRLTRSKFAERFPELLSAEPDVAVRALVAVVETPPAHPESGGEGEPHRYPITFDTVEGYLRPYSRPLQLLGDHRSAPVMVDALAAYLRQLAEPASAAEPDEQVGEGSDPDAPDRLLRLLVSFVHHPEIWARLLEAGAGPPQGLGRRLLPLLDTSALLAHPATRYAAGLLIRALGPLLTKEEHAALEGRILAVEGFFDTQDPEQAERAGNARDQLLGSLDPARAQTGQARARLAALATGNGPPELHPPMQVVASSTAFTFADYLVVEGVADADIPSPLRNALASLYDDVPIANDDPDPQRKQAARDRLPGEIETVLTLAAEPSTGPLTRVVDELIARAAAIVGVAVPPDSLAAQRWLDLLLRHAASGPSDGGDRP